MAYPKNLLSPDEAVVLDFRPHWSRIFREIALSIGVLILLVLLATVFDFEARGWVMAAIAVVWLALVVGGVARWWFTQHVVTTERVILRTGIFSREGKEIPHEVINDVSFRQAWWERLIGSGHLFIASAGEMGFSHYRDIPKPEEMQTVIYRVRENRMMEIERGGRVGAGPGPISSAQQLEILSRLHDEGKLSDDEFAEEKVRLRGEGA
ncbi:hypothetical protein BH23ACT5_BH23ACT5_05570 [soil metagenome]